MGGMKRPEVIETAVTRVPAEGDLVMRRETVVAEEPLEVRVDGRRLLLTMRTPGDDLDLVRGLLYSEGFIQQPGDIVAVQHCTEVEPEERGNVVVVALREDVTLDPEWTARATVMNSACGVCGTSSVELVHRRCGKVAPGPALDRELILSLPARLNHRQAIYNQTGGLHAAGLFDATGKLLCLKEDVGRHNAVDKLIGEAMRFGLLPLDGLLLMVSSRAGFEIVQKACRARIPVICCASAPTSLAIELARQSNQTLVAFLRDDRFTIYSGAERLRMDETAGRQVQP